MFVTVALAWTEVFFRGSLLRHATVLPANRRVTADSKDIVDSWSWEAFFAFPKVLFSGFNFVWLRYIRQITQFVSSAIVRDSRRSVEPTNREQGEFFRTRRNYLLTHVSLSNFALVNIIGSCKQPITVIVSVVCFISYTREDLERSVSYSRM